MPDTKTVNYKLIYSPRENFDGNAEVNGESWVIEFFQ